MKYVLLALIISFHYHSLNANPKERLKTKKWETIDLVFKTKKKLQDPFNEKMGCFFTTSDGIDIDIPGFYNGNNEWVVRFTPSKTGTWNAKSYASIKDLSGIEREVQVSENDPSNHGGITINDINPKHFAYESGKPYYLLAFEADWLFALDYGDPNLPKTKELVKHIRENGFNQVIMNVYAYDVRWKKDPDLEARYDYGSREDIYPFGGTNENPDHSTLNVAFFQHFDRIIELLNENNLVAHLMIYVWNKEVSWPKSYSKEDNLYFDYVVKRYQAYNNVIWDISKEALGYGHDDINYITNRIDRLRKLDAYNRLVTVHDYAYCSQYPEKVDIISIQSWSTNIYNNMLEISKKYGDKPVFNIEHGGYERCQYEVFVGNYDDPEVCLKRNYLCAFAGIYTTYYWQGSSWNVILHDPFSSEVESKPKFEYYKHFQAFWEKYKFEGLSPGRNLSASGFCMTNNKDTYIYYIPSENAAIDIKNLKKSDVLEVTWFNPETGVYKKTGNIPWRSYFRLNPEFKDGYNILILVAK